MPEVIDMQTREQVKSKALTWPERARALMIHDEQDYRDAADLLLGIKALRAEIAETFDPHIKRAFDAHRALVAEKREADTPLNEAESIIKGALLRWSDEQERLRLDEQRRLEAEARRREEEDRINLAAHMETEGKEFGDAAMVAEAHEMIEKPAPAPVVAVTTPAAPKVAGIVHRSTFRAEVVNLTELIRYVANNPQFINLLVPNQTALNAQAKSLKAAMAIPGVRVIEDKTVAAGGR